jgi:hypothetical protein
MATRKRARTESGEFRGDDPSTPDVNEAWEDEPVTAKKTAAKKTVAKKKATPKKTVSADLPPPGSAAYKAMILRGEIEE